MGKTSNTYPMALSIEALVSQTQPGNLEDYYTLKTNSSGKVEHPKIK
jgi:hypothetical protein